MVNSKNRLAIFTYYDESFGIRSYVSYFLKELKTVVNELIVIVNGKITEDDLKKLQEYATNVYIRENRGFDGGAYQYAICEVLGQDKLCKYEQVVLANNSFYGPFVPLVQIFDKMDKQHLDFWGINSYFCEGIRPFVESYFLVIQNKMLHSLEFWDFWNKLDSDIEVISEIIRNFEWNFTWYFEDLGYRWNTYVDKKDERENGQALDIYKNPYNALQKIGLPILKRKAFEKSELRQRDCNEGARILDYLYNKTNYNINYILQDIHERYGQESGLNFDYVFDTQGKISGHEKEAAIICIAHKECIDYIQKKLSGNLINFNYYILVQNDAGENIVGKNIYLFNDLNSCKRLIENIVERYRYVCYIRNNLHSSEISFDLPQMEIDYIFANLVGNNTYINKIIDILSKKEYLNGLFLKQDKNMFWIRSKLMLNILQSIKNENQWMERIGESLLTYIEKTGGTWGTVMCAESAATANNKHVYELDCICRRFGLNSVDGLIAREYRIDDVIKFCNTNNPVYIYGAGTYARHITEELFFRGITVKGIIVTDGQPKKEYIYIYPVYYLSEIEITSETGVVIAVKLRKEIRKNLLEKGCKKMITVT